MDSQVLSVVIPVYNSEDTITHALASLAPLTSLIAEIVVSDDGSHDNTLGVVRRWSASQSVPIKYVGGQNAGAGSARNRGFSQATGEWVLFLDADDYVEPRQLELLLADALGAEEQIIAVAGGRTEILDNGRHRDIDLDIERWASTDPKTLLQAWLRRTGPSIHLGSVLARRSALTPPLFPETRVGQDREYITSLIVRGGIKLTNRRSLVYYLDVPRQVEREARYADDLVRGSTFAFLPPSETAPCHVSNLDSLSRLGQAVAHLVAMRALSKSGSRRQSWRHWIEAVRLQPKEATRFVYLKRLIR